MNSAWSFEATTKPSFTPNYPNYAPLDITPLDNEEFFMWLDEFKDCLAWVKSAQALDPIWQATIYHQFDLELAEPNYSIMSTFTWDTIISCQLLTTIH